MKTNKIIFFEKNISLNPNIDFKQETLNEIKKILVEKHKKTGANTFNVFDFENLISIENLKDEVKKELFYNIYDFTFVNLQIDTEVHKINKEHSMQSNLYSDVNDSLKSVNIFAIAYTKRYNIENEIPLKLKDIKENIDLEKVPFKFHVV